MMRKMILSVVASCAILSCTTNSDSGDSNADPSGVYVREYAFEVSNPETGKKIGMRHIRDSIFVESTEDGYQVSNRKWGMNDYDDVGWVSMSHAEDRPLPTFFASYDEKLGALTPENSGLMKPILVENGRLFKDSAKGIVFEKVN